MDLLAKEEASKALLRGSELFFGDIYQNMHIEMDDKQISEIDQRVHKTH